MDLTQAEIIVSVGRGIKEQKNIELARQLAEALGGEIAASRPICDSGWLPMDRQIGSSGQTVAPKLYLALGISGAIQHIVGMKGARTIIAINKDSEAPIFEIADIAVVGNLFDIVPPLIEEVKKAKAERKVRFQGFTFQGFNPGWHEEVSWAILIEIWSFGRRQSSLAVHVYRQTEAFPKTEIYGLTSQIRRAAISVVSNIAEGQGRLTPGEFQQFLGTHEVLCSSWKRS